MRSPRPRRLRRSELCALRWDDIVEVPRWPDARVRDAVAERSADKTAWALRIEHSKRGRTPMFGFGGATVDGVELPVWPQLLTSSARY